jgi:hypothetical protein
MGSGGSAPAGFRVETLVGVRAKLPEAESFLNY